AFLAQHFEAAQEELDFAAARRAVQVMGRNESDQNMRVLKRAYQLLAPERRNGEALAIDIGDLVDLAAGLERHAPAQCIVEFLQPALRCAVRLARITEEETVGGHFAQSLSTFVTKLAH